MDRKQYTSIGASELLHTYEVPCQDDFWIRTDNESYTDVISTYEKEAVEYNNGGAKFIAVYSAAELFALLPKNITIGNKIYHLSISKDLENIVSYLEYVSYSEESIAEALAEAIIFLKIEHIELNTTK